ncbi:MAG: hypothetical protein HKN86_05310 [Acidimicrobiia bacterium]|nr:hypothetical protein [Acidimicrobiia bacterium]
MLHLLPYALAAYGGISGYKSAKEAGVSPLGSLVHGALGAYGGYSMGSAGMGMFPGSAATTKFAAMPLTQSLTRLPGISAIQTPVKPSLGSDPGTMAGLVGNEGTKQASSSSSLFNILRNRDAEGNITKGYDPLKVGGSLAALTYLGGAFDPNPTDIYTPGYNTNYLKTREERSYAYIDPVTGEEKEYKKVYVPEENPNDPGMQMNVSRLRVGGIAEIKKFNEGGINYLPSKTTHDENDSNNYVRALGYVEDGAGVGDKDEDTMLAQLADGEFVTRADGVLGAGIIAGANPNSMKDMREKGAAYFYEQQKRYKRVFDLLKEANGNSKQKTN